MAGPVADTYVDASVKHGADGAPPVIAESAYGGGVGAATRVSYAATSDVIGHEVVDTEGPYLLDSGDKLRIFVYGQPNLSRQYTVDQEGFIAVPLIGQVKARGKTTVALQRTIRARLGSEYVRDPQVTVDIQQHRPFFIYGEVKTAGQYPYVPGMSVETAIAIAGGFSERANERSFRVKRRVGGVIEQVETSNDYTLLPGDTVYVAERYF